MRRMRWLLCGLAFIGAAQQASAADLGDAFLRGSSTVINAGGNVTWDGAYFGGQVGGSSSGADFALATKSVVQQMLRQTTIENENPVSKWPLLGKVDTTAVNWGGFAGYNMQWDQAVIGIEANYNVTSITLSSADAMRRTFATSDGGNDVQLNGSSSVHITDYGTFRVRGGYALGNFLPYVMAGAAVGRADVATTATVTGRDPADHTTLLYQMSGSNIQTGKFIYGYTAGLGIDMALMQNFFIRAEYEFVQFAPIGDVNLHMHTARIGAAVKF
jgi:outer membrane immunogenic protein